MGRYSLNKFKKQYLKSSSVEENYKLLEEFYCRCKSTEELAFVFSCSEQEIINALDYLTIYNKKKCRECNRWLSYDRFGIDNSRADGYKYLCIDCQDKKYDVPYRNSEIGKQKARARSRKNYLKNIDKIKEKNKQNREYENEYRRERYNSSISVRLRDMISKSVKRGLKSGKEGKTFLEYISFSIQELESHLESQFVEGMNWDNYGDQWHIDHIRPISSFQIISTECDDFKKCWNLNNLQPLWKDLNKEKSDKWDGTEDNFSVQQEYKNDPRPNYDDMI